MARYIHNQFIEVARLLIQSVPQAHLLVAGNNYKYTSCLVAASQKHTLFALKNGNSNFYEANPETPFGRVVCNEKLHTLAKFGRFITLYARVFRSTRSLGWKSLVMSDSLISKHILEKASILQDWYFT
jgi:hypothetical protein